MRPSRPIKSDLKTHRIKLEEEKPTRWPYMKILREYSTLKREYAVDPYAEVYQMRDNVWAIFTESLDGMGDPWMYLIDGPEKAMLIDTSFGLGDLKGLCREIIGDKPLIVANTHWHFDHAFGNAQFDRCYCSECEVPRMERVNNSHIWDYLFDEGGRPKWTEFDRNDLIAYKHYEVVGVPDGYRFDLGSGYEVELVLTPGHTPGMSGYIDWHHHIMFTGDTNGITEAEPSEPFAENCCVEALAQSLRRLQPRFKDIEALFPGHGALDVTGELLQYTLDACELVLKNPECSDGQKVLKKPSTGEEVTILTKNIYQGSAIRYTPGSIYIRDQKRAQK